MSNNNKINDRMDEEELPSFRPPTIPTIPPQLFNFGLAFPADPNTTLTPAIPAPPQLASPTVLETPPTVAPAPVVESPVIPASVLQRPELRRTIDQQISVEEQYLLELTTELSETERKLVDIRVDIKVTKQGLAVLKVRKNTTDRLVGLQVEEFKRQDARAMNACFLVRQNGPIAGECTKILKTGRKCTKPAFKRSLCRSCFAKFAEDSLDT
jgi:hypothetical protein